LCIFINGLNLWDRRQDATFFFYGAWNNHGPLELWTKDFKLCFFKDFFSDSNLFLKFLKVVTFFSYEILISLVLTRMWWSFVCLTSLCCLDSASCKMTLHFLFGLMSKFSYCFCIKESFGNAVQLIFLKILFF